MAKNSRTKGKVGELDARNVVRAAGFEARRGQQYKGGMNSQDLEHNIPGIHVEVKRTEALSLYTAMEQAIKDAAKGANPVVFHRRNGKPWLAILLLDDFLGIMREGFEPGPSIGKDEDE